MLYYISNQNTLTTVDTLVEQCEANIFILALVLDIPLEVIDFNWLPQENHSFDENLLNQLIYELGRLKALKSRLQALGDS